MIMEITITIKREEIRIVARLSRIQLIITFTLLGMILGKGMPYAAPCNSASRLGEKLFQTEALAKKIRQSAQTQ